MEKPDSGGCSAGGKIRLPGEFMRGECLPVVGHLAEHERQPHGQERDPAAARVTRGQAVPVWQPRADMCSGDRERGSYGIVLGLDSARRRPREGLGTRADLRTMRTLDWFDLSHLNLTPGTGVLHDGCSRCVLWGDSRKGKQKRIIPLLGCTVYCGADFGAQCREGWRPVTHLHESKEFARVPVARDVAFRLEESGSGRARPR